RVELGVDDAAAAGKPRPVVEVEAGVIDDEDRVDPGRLADVEILFAMVGREVDQARAGVGGDMVAGQQRARLGEKAAELVHRVAGDRASEVGAFPDPKVRRRANLNVK